MLSSAAAGGSLIAASLVLVIAVSALIGFRGFDSARAVSGERSVVVGGEKPDDREAGATPAKPATAVLGAARATGRGSRSVAAKRAAASRRRAKKAPARSGLTAPVAKKPAQPAAAPVAEQPAAGQPAPGTDSEAGQKQPAVPTPEQDIVRDVTGAVDGAAKDATQAVGDVLLDVRDLLP